MDLETVKRYDDTWWLEHLRQKTIFDADNIKAQKEWLVEQAEKVEKYEKTLLKIKELYESDDENKLDEFLYGLFTNETYNDNY